MDYPTGWYAFDAGLARFYVLETAWENTNVGTADLFKNDFDNHWGPTSAQYQWLNRLPRRSRSSLEPCAISMIARTMPASAGLIGRSVTKERSILSDVTG